MQPLDKLFRWCCAAILSLASPVSYGGQAGTGIMAAEAAILTPASCRNQRHAGVRYHVTRLNLGGAFSGVPLGLNYAGKVVGYALTANGLVPTLWIGDQVHFLPTLGGDYNKAHGISDTDEIVGESNLADDINARAVSWVNGQLRDMGSLGGPGREAFARAINARGLSGGASYKPGEGFRAVLWEPGIRELGWIAGGYNLVKAINESGVAVGRSDNFPALWRADGQAEILSWGSVEGEANDINNKGQVVGYASYFTAITWNQGRLSQLPSLGGYQGIANGINDRGEIVGQSSLPDGGWRAAIWRSGKVLQLDTLLDDESAGVGIAEATAINQRGQIAAVADGGLPVLLTPRPCK